MVADAAARMDDLVRVPPMGTAQRLHTGVTLGEGLAVDEAGRVAFADQSNVVHVLAPPYWGQPTTDYPSANTVKGVAFRPQVGSSTRNTPVTLRADVLTAPIGGAVGSTSLPQRRHGPRHRPRGEPHGHPGHDPAGRDQHHHRYLRRHERLPDLDHGAPLGRGRPDPVDVAVTGSLTFAGVPDVHRHPDHPAPVGGVSGTLAGCTTATAGNGVGSYAGTITNCCTGLTPTGPSAARSAVRYVAA